MGRGIPGDLTGELTKKLGGSFRSPSEHTFSKSIVLVMPDVFLKLRGLKQCPKTFGTTIARVPGLSCLVLGVSQGSVLQGQGGGHGVLLAAPSRATLPGSFLKGSRGDFGSPLTAHFPKP